MMGFGGGGTKLAIADRADGIVEHVDDRLVRQVPREHADGAAEQSGGDGERRQVLPGHVLDCFIDDRTGMIRCCPVLIKISPTIMVAQEDPLHAIQRIPSPVAQAATTATRVSARKTSAASRKTTTPHG